MQLNRKSRFELGNEATFVLELLVSLLLWIGRLEFGVLSHELIRAEIY